MGVNMGGAHHTTVIPCTIKRAILYQSMPLHGSFQATYPISRTMENLQTQTCVIISQTYTFTQMQSMFLVGLNPKGETMQQRHTIGL